MGQGIIFEIRRWLSRNAAAIGLANRDRPIDVASGY